MVTEANNETVREFLKRWSPWVAVFLGSTTLFAFGIVSRLPNPISQAIGSELIAQACRDFVLLAAYSIFAGRLMVLILWELSFTLIRVAFLQVPLQLSLVLPFKYRKKIFRFFARLRFFLDALYIAALVNPLEASVLFGGVVFLYLSGGTWQLVVGAIFALILVFGATLAIERDFKAGLRLKFRFYRHTPPNLERLRQVSYSTGFLAVSLMSSIFWFDNLINEAVLLDGISNHKVLFVGSDYTILINDAATDQHTITEWKMVPIDELDFYFKVGN